MQLSPLAPGVAQRQQAKRLAINPQSSFSVSLEKADLWSKPKFGSTNTIEFQVSEMKRLLDTFPKPGLFNGGAVRADRATLEQVIQFAEGVQQLVQEAQEFQAAAKTAIDLTKTDLETLNKANLYAQLFGIESQLKNKNKRISTPKQVEDLREKAAQALQTADQVEPIYLKLERLLAKPKGESTRLDEAVFGSISEGLAKLEEAKQHMKSAIDAIKARVTDGMDPDEAMRATARDASNGKRDSLKVLGQVVPYIEAIDSLVRTVQTQLDVVNDEQQPIMYRQTLSQQVSGALVIDVNSR